MKKRHTVEQIIRILNEAADQKVADVCRKHSISEQTYYHWKRKYGEMDLSEARRLKDLEEENTRLKRLVAEPSSTSKSSRK